MLLDLVEDGMSFEREQLVLHPEGCTDLTLWRMTGVETNTHHPMFFLPESSMHGLDLDLHYP